MLSTQKLYFILKLPVSALREQYAIRQGIVSQSTTPSSLEMFLARYKFSPEVILFIVYRLAKSYPGTAEPFVSGPVPLQSIKKGFIVLMSKGLYNGATRAVDGDEEASLALVRMIIEEMKSCSSLADVSRAVIDRVHGLIKTKYKESGGARMDCSSVDDMTLLIRNLGFPFEYSAIPRSLVLVPPVSVQQPVAKEAVWQVPPEVSNAYTFHCSSIN